MNFRNFKNLKNFMNFKNFYKLNRLYGIIYLTSHKNKNTFMQNKKTIYGLLIAIVLAAFLVRFINIDKTPAGLFPDEAVNGTDVLQANKTGEYKLFYEDNNGREGLFINIQAMSVKAFGNNLTGLKLPSIIFGVLTALGIFFLLMELFQNSYVSLIGSFMTAFSYWAINFSRIGFRANMVPFLLVWSFYFLFKGLRTQKFHDFIFAGLIFGLGVHTYIAFRVSPLVLIVLFIALWITKKDFLKTYWKHTLIFFVAVMVSAMPMLLDFFYFNPEHYASRTGQVSVLNPEVNKGNLTMTLVETLAFSLAKYNFWGDQNWRHNYPPYPLLNPLTGISFLIGFVFVTINFFRLLWRRFTKGIRDSRLAIYAFLLSWFFTLLIPEFLAYEGNPHALRAIGTIPVVMIIAALPFIWIVDKYKTLGHSLRVFVMTMIIISLSFIAVFDTVKYHVYFANNPKQHQSFEASVTQAAYYIQKLPSESEKFVIAQSMQRVPIKFLDDQVLNLTYYYPGEINQINPKTNTFEIIMTDKDDSVIKSLQTRFPKLKLETISNKFGDTFYILK